MAQDATPAKSGKFEGAVGLVLQWSPEYSGAARNRIGLAPAGFIRYGRITISGAGGFTTKRSDDVERGLDASLVQREHFKLNLGLRFDNGRNESSSDALAGVGGIKSTVRARFLMRWIPNDDWTLSSSVSTDILNRGGGYWVDFGAQRRWVLTPSTSLSLGGVVTLAGDRYLQSRYGITPEQSARSGYPVFWVAEGPRDVQFGATLRTEFSRDWAGFVNVGASRMLGDTVNSPLVRRVNAWSTGGGLAWRF